MIIDRSAGGHRQGALRPPFLRVRIKHSRGSLDCLRMQAVTLGTPAALVSAETGSACPQALLRFLQAEFSERGEKCFYPLEWSLAEC